MKSLPGIDMVPPDEKLNYSLIPQVMFTGEHSSGKQT